MNALTIIMIMSALLLAGWFLIVLATIMLDSYVPKATVEIRSDCPWHEKQGMKAYPEYYYDAQGRELDWETGKPVR